MLPAAGQSPAQGQIQNAPVLTTTKNGSQESSSLQLAIPSQQSSIRLIGSDSRWQLVVTQLASDGQERDVTGMAQITIQPPIAMVDSQQQLVPMRSGTAEIIINYQGAHCSSQLEINDIGQPQAVDFYNQIVPILTKHGCNGGGCHGKMAGQAGFKLSLLGFEPEDDFQRIAIESRGRRVFPAAAEESLLLLKATNDVPHGGGLRLGANTHHYDILRRWISSGMPHHPERRCAVTSLMIYPQQRLLSAGLKQQLAVWATFADGTTRDVTGQAQFESNNTDVATVDQFGSVQIGQRTGDAAVMARYQGKVAVFTASVPLGAPLDPFPPTRNVVDQAVFAKLKRLAIPPSPLCDDSQFIRRSTLDICGRLPTPEEAKQFVACTDSDKSERLIDRLLDSEDHADYFARKWVMILRNKRDSVGEQFGSFAFHQWLRDRLHRNHPYDQWVRQLLTASGSLEAEPALTWWREVTDSESRVEDAAQMFLGQRLQCARCHHHPFEKWSQADYYQMAAFFTGISRKEGPTAENPVFISRPGPSNASHPKSGKTLAAAGLDAQPAQIDAIDDPRQHLVDWMVKDQNPFFAKALVNRYWKHFMGLGLVEPEDDMRITNPPSNPELLDALAKHFSDSGYDLKSLIRLICRSSVYRLSSDPNQHNLKDNSSYSRFYPKRLSAEVLLDALDVTALTSSTFDPLPAGSRAVQLPDTAFPSYFLDVFGRPAGLTACECERSNEPTLAQSLHLLNSKEMQGKLTNAAGRAAAMAANSQPLSDILNDLYWAALARPATPVEMQAIKGYVDSRADKRREAFEDVVWSIINSKEFLFAR
jgi:hypothetical protein